MVDISIIIVNYNVKEFILNLLRSLQPALENLSSEVIVVDNASEDDSVAAIREKYPELMLIANKENIGFGAANNLGLEKCNGRFILFLNPDTIVRKDTFTTLIDFFNSHPDAGMAGCKVLNPDGSFQLPCRRGFPGPWTSFTKLTGLSSLFPKSKLFAKYNLTYLDENKTYEVDAVSGAFMMLRREVYEKIGGFDPQFFMYGEDLDLCYRTQQSGYKVYYVHSTEIIHYKGESTKRSTLDETNVFYKAMQLFVKKHITKSVLFDLILSFGIFVRKIFAFANVYSLLIFPAIIDFVLYSVTIIIAEKIYANAHWPGFPADVKPYVYLLPALFQVFISFLTDAYKKNTLSILRILVSLIVGFILLAFITFFLKQFAFSRVVLLLAYAFAVLMFTVWRIVTKVVFKIGLDVALKSRTLLVGFGESAIEVGKKLRKNISSYHNIVGLIEEAKRDIGNKIDQYEVIGSIETLKKVINDYQVNEVVFNADKVGYEKMFTAISECQGTNVDFMVTGHELDFMVGKSVVTMLDNMPFLKVEYNISVPVNRFTKGLLDYLIGVFLFITLYPWFALKNIVFKSKGELARLILQIPSVLSRNKSFVGPRKNSYHGELFLGKPGLTGLWYIDDMTNGSSEEEDKLNIFYAKNLNVWLDLEIIGKTLSKIFLKDKNL